MPCLITPMDEAGRLAFARQAERQDAIAERLRAALAIPDDRRSRFSSRRGGPADSLQLRTVLDVIFTDDYNPTQNLDPLAEEDGYTKLNARVAVSDPNDTWEVALVGRNLTDEEIVSYANDTPLAANLFQTIGHYAIIERERTVAIQGLYRF